MPVGRNAGLLLALCGWVLVTGARPVQAQAASRKVPLEMSSDSTAWQRVLVYVMGALGTQIVQAAADTTPQPWHLRLPPYEPQRRLIERQLTTILRLRSVTENDTVVYTLELGALSVVNDTAHVKVSTDVARRCAGTTRLTGFGTVEEVWVPRAPQGFWGAARSSSVLVGDRTPCPRPGR